MSYPFSLPELIPLTAEHLDAPSLLNFRVANTFIATVIDAHQQTLCPLISSRGKLTYPRSSSILRFRFASILLGDYNTPVYRQFVFGGELKVYRKSSPPPPAPSIRALEDLQRAKVLELAIIPTMVVESKRHQSHEYKVMSWNWNVKKPKVTANQGEEGSETGGL
jgi:hypothetical protein